VIENYSRIKSLQTKNIDSRGWLLDVLNCVNQIPSNDFYLKDVYEFADVLSQKHINNNNIEAKIRQQLQLLRDKGFIEFMERGHYRKLY
jgi:type II restriction enzyme